jgi:NitT/TauT family transport system ATP-binding protein
MAPILALRDLSFRFDGMPLFENISFSLQQGEIAALIGPSGCGKSTLMRCITGILKPLQGAVSIAEKDPLQARDSFAYMAQADLLLAWRTILDNVLLLPELAGHSKKRWRQQARTLLHDVGLQGWEERYPHELSGGMQRRTMLARALLPRRPLLLLDEPFASLDCDLRLAMYAYVRSLAKRENIAVLCITHELHDLSQFADRTLQMAT